MKLLLRAHWLTSMVLPWLLLSLLRAVAAKKDPALQCGACLALVDEMDNAIKAVDPKKKVQVGSFRVDSYGNQDLREIPYARSETHLVEAFESVCDRMNGYAETEQNGATVYMRTSSYDGSPVSLKKASISGDIHKKLKYACQNIVEDFEEEMTEKFKANVEEPLDEICIEVTGLCTKKDIERRMWALAEAMMAAMNEKTEDDGDGDEDEAEDEGDADQSEEPEEIAENTDQSEDSSQEPEEKKEEL